jgi:hypothetical protein
MPAVAVTMVRLDLWEVNRLLWLFEQVPQELEDKDLWLKLRHAGLKLRDAEEKLVKRETTSE